MLDSSHGTTSPPSSVLPGARGQLFGAGRTPKDDTFERPVLTEPMATARRRRARALELPPGSRPTTLASRHVRRTSSATCCSAASCEPGSSVRPPTSSSCRAITWSSGATPSRRRLAIRLVIDDAEQDIVEESMRSSGSTRRPVCRGSATRPTARCSSSTTRAGQARPRQPHRLRHRGAAAVRRRRVRLRARARAGAGSDPPPDAERTVVRLSGPAPPPPDGEPQPRPPRQRRTREPWRSPRTRQSGSVGVRAARGQHRAGHPGRATG